MAFLSEVEDDSSRILATLVSTHDRYVLPDGTEMLIGADEAWCRHCHDFVLVERLENPEVLEARARSFHSRKPPSFAALLPELDWKAIADRRLKEDLHEAEQWRIALASRRSPPRCLQCTGTDFIVLPPDGAWIDHPAGLPARVRVRPAYMHMSMCASGSRYDTEGLMLEHSYDGERCTK